jgi:hypothetical protein
MFAGLPGIGVGTLFYVLTALWMPVKEIGCLVRGNSSRARWRLIAVQLLFAVGIIASIAFADRLLMRLLGIESPTSATPAGFLHSRFASTLPESVLAAPITASLLLLVGVLISIEAMRLAARGAAAVRTVELEVGGRSSTRGMDEQRRSDTMRKRTHERLEVT